MNTEKKILNDNMGNDMIPQASILKQIQIS